MATQIKNDPNLDDSLISVWCTTSTVTEDVHGSNTLTNAGSVGTDTGVQGTASTFVRASSQRLHMSDNASISPTGDISIAGWVRFDTFPPSNSWTTAMLARYGSGTDSFIMQFRNDSGTNKIRFYNSDNGTALGSADISLGAISTGFWYHIGIAFDASAGSVEGFKNGISLGSATGNLKTSLHDATTDLEIGAWGGASNYHDGDFNQICFWSKLLNSTGFSDLYNSSMGIPYDAGGGDPAKNAIFAFGGF